MSYVPREKCVICPDSMLIPFKTFHDFPVKCIHDIYDVDLSWNLVIGTCEICGSVQQMNMLHPSIMYGGKYPLDTSHSPMWTRHYDSFSKFIRSSISYDTPVLEVGSSSCVLVDRLCDMFKDYTVFDYSLEGVTKRDTLKYVEGNCETYPFPSNCAVIMSHVFEHLFDPAVFIQNCAKNRVNTFLISIPTMEDTKRVHLTREHTFMYNNEDILYLFSRFGYASKAVVHDDFSIFYHFEYSSTVTTVERSLNPQRYLVSKDYFTKEFDIPPHSFLIGAGFWSQILLNSVRHKENIIGVLDNDPTKIEKLYFKTKLTVKPFTYLKQFGSEISVLVIQNKYWTQEVVDLIRIINPLISIHYIDYGC